MHNESATVIVVGETCPFPLPHIKEGALLQMRGEEIPFLIVQLHNPSGEDIEAVRAETSVASVAATAVGSLLFIGLNFGTVDHPRSLSFDIPLHIGIEPSSNWPTESWMDSFSHNDELRMAWAMICVDSTSKKVLALRHSSLPPNVSRYVAGQFKKQIAVAPLPMDDYSRMVNTAFSLFRDTSAIFQTAPAKGLIGD